MFAIAINLKNITHMTTISILVADDDKLKTRFRHHPRELTKVLGC